MSRSVEPSNDDLLRFLNAPPVRSHPQPLLGEGEHQHMGRTFTVSWQNPPIPNAAGWYYAYEERSLSGPYNTAHSAYLAALEDEAACDRDELCSECGQPLPDDLQCPSLACQLSLKGAI